MGQTHGEVHRRKALKWISKALEMILKFIGGGWLDDERYLHVHLAAHSCAPLAPPTRDDEARQKTFFAPIKMQSQSAETRTLCAPRSRTKTELRVEIAKK
jgi:hypothetical protein